MRTELAGAKQACDGLKVAQLEKESKPLQQAIMELQVENDLLRGGGQKTSGIRNSPPHRQ